MGYVSHLAGSARRTGVPFRPYSVAAALFLAGAPVLWAVPAVTIAKNGPPTNRIDIVYVAEGFMASEMPAFVASVAKAVAWRDTAEVAQPYKRYRKFFNFHRVDLPSPVSGITHPGEAQKNTPLQGKADNDRLGTVNGSRLTAEVVAGLQPLGITDDRYNHAVLNDPAYFNSGGAGTCVFAMNYWGEIALHEGGHAFHALADEYGGTGAYSGSEPREINVTADRTGAKWSTWMGYQQPRMNGAGAMGANGAFEGGRYVNTGIWRPTQNSKMNLTSQSRPYPFNMPSIEKIILDIYAKVKPVDTAMPNAVRPKDPDSLWVRVIDPAVLKVDWLLNGQMFKADGGPTLNLRTNPLPIGTHTVKAHVYDEIVKHANTPNATPHALDWVRKDLARLQQDVEWTVEVTTLTSSLLPPQRLARVPAGSRGGNLAFHLRRDGAYRLSIVAADGAVIEVLRGTGRSGPNAVPWTPSRAQAVQPLFLRVE